MDFLQGLSKFFASWAAKLGINTTEETLLFLLLPACLLLALVNLWSGMRTRGLLRRQELEQASRMRQMKQSHDRVLKQYRELTRAVRRIAKERETEQKDFSTINHELFTQMTRLEESIDLLVEQFHISLDALARLPQGQDDSLHSNSSQAPAEPIRRRPKEKSASRTEIQQHKSPRSPGRSSKGRKKGQRSSRKYDNQIQKSRPQDSFLKRFNSDGIARSSYEYDSLPD